MIEHTHFLPGNATEPFVWARGGNLYVGIDCFAAQVEFCPVCGAKASELSRVAGSDQVLIPTLSALCETLPANHILT